MKILIAFYSKDGNTEKAVSAVEKEFQSKGYSVDIERIKPVDEHSFFGWCFIRMFKGECDIHPVKINNVSSLD